MVSRVISGAAAIAGPAPTNANAPVATAAVRVQNLICPPGFVRQALRHPATIAW